jgi:hypothetical protein
VSAECNGESEGFDGQASKDESRSAGGGIGGEEHDGGDGEKESSGHDEQTGVFHALSLS